ncbi:MAG: toxic anion resistance protein, partial [Candidatus Saccharibacteria bacterium]|nr:toxic anion resistance protein [Rhodoferax sp.]
MSETKTVSVPTFTLTAPEVLQPIAQEVAKTAVPLQAETKTAVDDQVERFMTGLLNEDLQSEAFKSRLDSAFALGREEISVASS